MNPTMIVLGLVAVLGCIGSFFLYRWVSGSSDFEPTVTIVGDHPSADQADIRELPVQGRVVEWEVEGEDDPIPIPVRERFGRKTPEGTLFYANLETGEVWSPDWSDLRNPNTGETFATPEHQPGIERITPMELREEQKSTTIEDIYAASNDAVQFWASVAPWAFGGLALLMGTMMYMMVGG